jgi:alkanesulfonate monooxygenase SsuD/methylene tetrahydromethanopterin reductase-like flavin-dependent oxidoreductase (luciferase family)
LNFGTWIFPISPTPEDDGATIDGALREAELAEEVGFHSVWLAEHHFDGAAAYADPVVFAAAIAARTSRVKIGFAVVESALHHPARLAAQCSLLDHLSKGRLIVGIGRGSVANHYEYTGFGVNLEMGFSAVNEMEELLVRAWTEENVVHKGEYWDIEFPILRPQPYTKPHPPIIRAGISDGSIKAAAVACRPLLMGGVAAAGMRERLELYRATALEAGHSAEAVQAAIDDIWFTADALVADTHAEARALVDKHLAIEQNVIANARMAFNPKQWVESDEGRKWLTKRTIEDGFIFGTPSEVTEKFAEIRDAGVKNIMLKVNIGNMPPAVYEHSIRLLGSEILPNFA